MLTRPGFSRWPLAGLTLQWNYVRQYNSRVESGLLCHTPVLLAGDDGPMLWTIFAILLILWLLGWGFHIAGSLIHLLLVVAVIVLIINLVTGRRAV